MKWHYFLHLVGWTVPLLLGQWVIGWRVFLRNAAAVFGPAVIGMIFFSACDSFAVRSGIWRFDAAQILGWHVGPLPVEEVMFFFLTSLLVTQSLLLLMPASYRR